ncbi:MAG: NAD(+) synthase [Lachnospiraceae bacterium]|nr:NAD(+) synthase [Lachnospiraceae bacterium]
MSVPFDAESEIEGIKNWIRKWFEENGPGAGAVIGLSGGKDSTIVGKLLVDALGAERVTGVLMPDGVQADLNDSLSVAKLLGIKYYVVNIGGATAGLKEGIMEACGDGLPLGRDALINIPPRIRMSVLYAIAQSLPGGGRVVNTCNMSEDYIGYSTKYGDAAGDFSPCADYTVTQMKQIGDALGLPAQYVHKTPSDGLSGMSDEDKIGFSYETLDHYIETGECEDAATKERIDRMHRANLHKLRLMPKYARRTAEGD